MGPDVADGRAFSNRNLLWHPAPLTDSMSHDNSNVSNGGMTTVEQVQPGTHKAQMIDLHTEQAGDFESRYEALARDAYGSTFTYGRKKIEELIDRELAGLPVTTRALDVGCGTGFNVMRLRGRGYTVVGLEPAQGMRERAQRLNPGAEIVDGDIEKMPFPDASFDLVISIEVIRYLKDPSKGLAEIARVLRPGGTAIITAAPMLSLNGYALINQVTSRVNVPTFHKVSHSFLTVNSAKKAMREAGFASTEVRGAFLGPWHVVARVSKKALAVALKAYEPIDNLVSDLEPVRNFSNHLVLIGRR
jgi:ubiquinone/menaquinone biosynthesis C-methylase UbiE